MQPSQDRYREIQQALIDKGYLQGEATGAWDATSVTALNRFKQDQNQKADGRLDSRSLIALGLGPKKDSYISVPGALAAEQAIGSQDQQ
jgi:peptidoglycan hydrolase-like protein with peptidoglycan-binding domain